MALLIGAVSLIYGQTLDHEWVDFDDLIYLRDNVWLREPLDFRWVMRSLREPYAAYWIPLTWLSYRVEFLVSDGAPSFTFAINAGLHAANSALLYAALRLMTGARWRSAFVAAVFAVHPLHVESVAWASERKDVLSAFFWMLGLNLYALARRTRRRNVRDAYDIGVALCLAFGLLAKPMLVTFPFSLLLLDAWPLNRFGAGESFDRVALKRAVIEKLHLFAMAAGAALIVLGTQDTMGGRSFTAGMSALARVANAMESYAWYVAAACWPTDLAVFYPLDPIREPHWRWIPIGFVIALVTALGIRGRLSAPWFIVGWLWFLGNLVPVIGFVGVGMQARADRWMYIPLIGLSLIVAWAIPSPLDTHTDASIASRYTRYRPVATALAAILSLASLSGLAYQQVGFWRDTQTLFEHAARVASPNWYAEHRLAIWHRQRGEFGESMHHYIASLQAEPRQAYTQGELADVARALGDDAFAMRLYENVARTGWRDRHAGERLAAIFLASDRPEVAVELLERVLARRPTDTAVQQLLEEARIATH